MIGLNSRPLYADTLVIAKISQDLVMFVIHHCHRQRKKTENSFKIHNGTSTAAAAAAAAIETNEWPYSACINRQWIISILKTIRIINRAIVLLVYKKRLSFFLLIPETARDFLLLLLLFLRADFNVNLLMMMNQRPKKMQPCTVWRNVLRRFQEPFQRVSGERPFRQGIKTRKDRFS